MGSCCGNNKGNKRVKEWGSENSRNKSLMGLDLKSIIVGLLLIAFIIYKFII